MADTNASNTGGASDSKKDEPLEGTRPQQQQAPLEDDADVPDPDEDDLDDLDDMLDEFSTVKLDEKKPEPQPGSARPGATSAAAADKMPSMDDILSDEEFAEQLQAGMADLLGEMENSAEMKAHFESIFKELDATSAAESDAARSPASPAPAAPSSNQTAGATSEDASFQETIRRTMERMQTSGDQATAAAAAEGSDDFMAELLKQMQAGSLEGEGSEEELSKMLLGMMEQLTNKEILYEPMKELHDKFPGWLEKNRDKVSQDDLKRYEEQQRLVKEIITRFDAATYSDTNVADREYIVERMQKIQAAGSPPADLVGEMPSAQDAFNAPDEACNPQ